jgi:septation ring formation regulator EzrA
VDYFTGKRLDLMLQQQTQILSRLEEMDMAFQDMITRVTNIDVNLDKVSAEVAALRALYDTLSAGEVVTLEQLAEMDSRLASIEGKVTNIDAVNPDA